MGKKKIRGRTAWIVTRHWIAEYPRCEVAAIFSGRLGGVRVRELVEVLYVSGGAFTLSEQLSMKWAHQGQCPYHATFGQTVDGQPWEAEILCGIGNDPYLEARIVDDLTVERGADGKETVVYRKRPRPQIAGTGDLSKQRSGGARTAFPERVNGN
jgi:hypothetical protein